MDNEKICPRYFIHKSTYNLITLKIALNIRISYFYFYLAMPDLISIIAFNPETVVYIYIIYYYLFADTSNFISWKIIMENNFKIINKHLRDKYVFKIYFNAAFKRKNFGKIIFFDKTWKIKITLMFFVLLKINKMFLTNQYKNYFLFYKSFSLKFHFFVCNFQDLTNNLWKLLHILKIVLQNFSIVILNRIVRKCNLKL